MIEIFDSTLRDGAQGEGISFSVSDKLNIVKVLDEFGVDYIEAGNPGSNPKDLDFFSQVSKIKLSHAKLCAFGSTCRKSTSPKEDANIKSILDANTPVAVIFGKSWDLHVTEILRISLEDNLKIVTDTLNYLRSQGKEVFFDAEHFFDGYKANPEYAMEVLSAACRGGAVRLVLCDTNGGTLPLDVFNITRTVKEAFPDVQIGIHCHNDTGCAVANSLMAVEAGATQVQGTFIGIGERCGNADLSVIIPTLKLKSGYGVGGKLEMLFNASRAIAEIANTQIENSRPYTGKSAFTHKAGMHIDGVLKVSRSFEHIDPAKVGNERKFLLSEVAGRGTVLTKVTKVAPELKKDSPETAEILKILKEREHFGYQYEAADASFELLVKKVMGTYKPHFNVIMYKTIGEFPPPEGDMQASATIKIEVDGKTEITAAMGRGPVNALDLALRKALKVFYPEIAKMHLSDYKVRVLENNQATAARVRVLIDSTDENDTWTTIGVSNDIIEASFIALVDSIEYKLSKS